MYENHLDAVFFLLYDILFDPDVKEFVIDHVSIILLGNGIFLQNPNSSDLLFMLELMSHYARTYVSLLTNICFTIVGRSPA